MGDTKSSGAEKLPELPPIKLRRFKDATLLIEELVSKNTDVFIEAGQKFKAQHRQGARRPLDPMELASVAQGMNAALRDGEDRMTIKAAKAEIEDAGLEAYDEPQPMEVLTAAGVATAPALIDAVSRFVALIEMPADVYKDACENDCLSQTLDEAIAGFEDLELSECKARATAAIEHVAQAQGVEAPKAWGLITQAVLQGLNQAMSHLTSEQDSTSSASTSSAVSTGGADEKSSTTQPGTTPSD